VISWADTVDPQACNTNSSIYEKVSRDPERTPCKWQLHFYSVKSISSILVLYFYSYVAVQWNSGVNGGFSNGAHTWLPVSPDYKTLNVENQLAQNKSHLQVFLRLINIKNTHTLQYGNFQSFVFNNVLVILRQLKQNDNFITVANLGSTNETVDLSKLGNLPNLLEYVVVCSSSQHELW
jgi:alpha-glucosidase